MINHPDWCDRTRCDAVEGDEVQDFSGAHRSTRTKTVGLVWFELVQVVAPTAQRTHLVLGRGRTREWAYPVEDLAPELLGLLGSAGYTSASTVDAPTLPVLEEIQDERRRQDAKWGEQNHPDGTGHDWAIFGTSGQLWLEVVRAALEQSTKPRYTTATSGTLALVELVELPPTGPTWLLIALEEVFEALVETDPAKLRDELLQVAAVAVAWIEAIDRRGAQ